MDVSYTPPMVETPPASTPRWRRRIAWYLLVVCLAAIGVHVYESQPVRLVVVYRYGRLADGLRHADFFYSLQDDPEPVLRVRFNYRKGTVPDRQRHRIRLPRGQYAVTAELHHAPVIGIDRGRVPPPIRLRTTLPVRQEGQATIHLETLAR